ncbi:hypothetical protein VTJ83DRAFT_4496 [Remersonia thermophila]|uniref:PD-(D/E)XK endonuclease-like domain-containing protein n=1 Tax=Remersonia thermophila TaxID=72144 RepID=A0ABR4DA32_9PEZI
MANFGHDSDPEYSLGLTVSEEEGVWAIVDRLSANLRPTGVPPPQQHRQNLPAQGRQPARITTRPIQNPLSVPPPDSQSGDSQSPSSASTPSPASPSADPDVSRIIEETLAAIEDDDLNFDIAELGADDSYAHGQSPFQHHHHVDVSRGGPPERHGRFSPPARHGDDSDAASLAASAKPRSLPVLLPGPDVRYPDLSAALSQIAGPAQQHDPPDEGLRVPAQDKRSPLKRFRTYPQKPLTVSDLTAGVWCELQYWYTLTKLPGGRRRRTTAMKLGSTVHAMLEREVFTEVQVTISKKEEHFGLKLWNMIEGLRMLRDEGMTREFELWGMVDGNLVCGIIDGISSENPDQELEQSTLSSRASSQAPPNSQPYASSGTANDDEGRFYITEIKTRTSATPPPAAQEKVAVTQVLLYHRFLSDLAAGSLNFFDVFKRYGFNPDEPFSDAFMAQTGEIHDEILAASTDAAEDGPLEPALPADDDDGSSSGGEFVSAPSSPTQLSLDLPPPRPTPRYHNLRSLAALVRAELELTFPRGGASIGSVASLEYRYRQQDLPESGLDEQTTEGLPYEDPGLPRPGDVIFRRSIFVEPHVVDLFIEETMPWWRGERPPRGVNAHDAGLKCRMCEFADECEWLKRLDEEALRNARSKLAGSAATAEGGGAVLLLGADRDGSEASDGGGGGGRGKRKGKGKGRLSVEAGLDDGDGGGLGDIEDGGVPRETPKKRGRGRGRPRKADADAASSAAGGGGGGGGGEEEAGPDGPCEAPMEEEKKKAKRGRGRPRKSEAVPAVEPVADSEGPPEVEDGEDWRGKSKRTRRGRRMAAAGAA